MLHDVTSRNTDFGTPSVFAGDPRFRQWRLYDQVRRGTLSKRDMLDLLRLPEIAGGATTLTPSWTQNPTAPIAIQTLTLGSVVSGTLDLSSKLGGYVYLFVGKQATTSLTTGVTWYVRRKQNTTVDVPTTTTLVGTTGACILQVLSNVGNGAGSSTFTVTSGAFSVGDVVFLDGTGGAVGLADSEWDIVQHVATHVFTSGKNGGLEFTYNNSCHVSNLADVYALPLDGGAIWEVVCANLSAAGPTCAVRCLCETFDSVAGT